MKKVLLLLILSILFIPGSVLAADTDLNVSRVPFKVVINEQKIGGDDEYPLLFYKDIVRHNRLEPHAVQKGKFVAIMR